MIVSWFVTGSVKIGMAIGGIEAVTKMILYFLHERAWFKFYRQKKWYKTTLLKTHGKI